MKPRPTAAPQCCHPERSEGPAVDLAPGVKISNRHQAPAFDPPSTKPNAAFQALARIHALYNCHPEQREGPAVDPAPWVKICNRHETPAVAPPSTKPSTHHRALTSMHALYKTLLSPILHSPLLGPAGDCRFQPTCSEYATMAFAQHGPARGLWLTLTRLLRCHPLTRGGWDPVPPRTPPTSSESRFDPPRTPPAGTIEKPDSTNDSA